MEESISIIRHLSAIHGGMESLLRKTQSVLQSERFPQTEAHESAAKTPSVF